MSSFLDDYKEKSIERHSLIEEEEEKENKINILQNESYSEENSEEELERSIISLDVMMPKNANKNLLKDTDAKKKASKNVNKISRKNKTGVIENISSERIIGLEEDVEERKVSRIERIEAEWNDIFDSCKNDDTFFDDENNYQRLVSLRSECKTVLRWTHLFCFGNAAKQSEKARVRKILGGVDRIMPQATRVRKMTTDNERKTGVGQFLKNLCTKSWSGIKAVGREIFGPITSISVREFTEEKGIKSKLKGLLTVPGRFLGTLIFSYAWTAVVNSIFFALNTAYCAVRPFLRVPVWLVDGIAQTVQRKNSVKQSLRVASFESNEAELFGYKGSKNSLSDKLKTIMFDKDEKQKTKDAMDGRVNQKLEAVDEQIEERMKFAEAERFSRGKFDEYCDNADSLMGLLNQSIIMKKLDIKDFTEEDLQDEKNKAYVDRMNEIINAQQVYLNTLNRYIELKRKLGPNVNPAEVGADYDKMKVYGFKNAWKSGAAKKMKVKLPYLSFRAWQARWDRQLFKGNLAGYGYNEFHAPKEIINEEDQPANQIQLIANLNPNSFDLFTDKNPEWINLWGWGKLTWKTISTFTKNIVSDYDDKSKIEARMQGEMDDLLYGEDYNDNVGDEYFEAMEEAEELVNGNIDHMDDDNLIERNPSFA